MIPATGRQGGIVTRPIDYRKDIRWWAILLLCVALNFTGLSWGLPTSEMNWEHHSPAPEIPLDILTNFTGYEYIAYTQAFPIILIGVYSPYLLYAHARGDIRFDFKNHTYDMRSPLRTKTALIFIARLTSAVMSLLLLFVIFKLTLLLFDYRTALMAALVLTACFPFVFLAHTSTVNMCATLSGFAAQYYFFHCLQSGRLRHYLLTGIFAGLSVATKEYMYACMLPIPIILFIDLFREKQEKKAIKLLLLCLPSLFTFLFFTNILFNPQSFFAHLSYYASGKTFPKPSLPLLSMIPTFFSFIEVGIKSYGFFLFGFGMMGLAIAVKKPPRFVISVLLIPAASFFILYLCVYRLVIYRYAFFLIVLMSVFTAVFIVNYLLRPGRLSKRAKRILLTVLLVSVLWESIGVTWDFLDDPRYDVERWMAQNLPKGAIVEIMDDAYNLPRSRFELTGFIFRIAPWQFVPKDLQSLKARNPDCILLNSILLDNSLGADFGSPIDEQSIQTGAYFSALFSGRMGYKPVAEFLPPRHFKRIRFYNLNQTYYLLLRDDLAKHWDPLPSFVGLRKIEAGSRRAFAYSPKDRRVAMISELAGPVISDETPAMDFGPEFGTRKNYCMVELDGDTYTIGGQQKKFGAFASSDDILLRPAGKPKWVRAAKLPLPLDSVNCNGENGRLLIEGGRTNLPARMLFALEHWFDEQIRSSYLFHDNMKVQ